MEQAANASATSGGVFFSGFVPGETGIGAVRQLNPQTGELGDSILVQPLNGTGQTGIGVIQGQNDGSIFYGGNGTLGSNNQTATYWVNDLQSPFLAANNTVGISVVTAASSNGIFVGNDGNGAASFGTIGGSFQNLVGGLGQSALDINSDGEFIIGSSIWRQDEFGSYTPFSTSGFEGLDTDFFLLGGWQGTAIDPVTGDAVFFGQYIDASLNEGLGIWDENGVLRLSAEGDFADAQIWEGELFFGTNIGDEGQIFALSDGSNRSLLDITGLSGRVAEDGLFEGSAGFLTSSGFITTNFTNSTAVPEPSSFLLLASAGLFGFRRKRRAE